jgi:N6-L-threonylcarbamoyladenine synthase
MLRSNQTPADQNFYDFSFSGLKTAVAHLVRELDAMGVLEVRRPDVAAAFQEAVVDVLVSKTYRAVAETKCNKVLLGGGVSANEVLRAEMGKRLGSDVEIFRASPRLSLDNGAMVARAGRFRLERGEVGGAELEADAKLPFPGMTRRSAI